MKLQFFVPRWGSENLSWDEFLSKAKSAGYDGIEYAIPNETTREKLDAVWEKLEQYQMKVIPQHYGTYDADFNLHFDRYSAWLELVCFYPAVKIDSQTGKDFFSFEQNEKLIAVATEHTNNYGIKVYHETHRNKSLFAAHICNHYLKKIQNLEITLDVSHWINVAESYLEDQPEAMELAMIRTGHIHARVGYTEGPQVPDPRIAEWQDALKHHFKWWDNIATRFRNNNATLTITPEFGPYPYMVHLPGNNAPIADQWEINQFMKDLLQERYDNL